MGKATPLWLLCGLCHVGLVLPLTGFGSVACGCRAWGTAGCRVELDTPPSVKTAATLFRSICYNNKDSLMAGIIIAGYDPVDGGQVYAIPMGGTCVRQKVAFGGACEVSRDRVALLCGV